MLINVSGMYRMKYPACQHLGYGEFTEKIARLLADAKFCC